jgi:hypothetical protein
VTNENFRRELDQVFDDMAGSPSAALPDRVRSSVTQAPDQRGPFWIAGVAAAAIAVVVIGVLVVANPLNRHNTVVPGVASSPTPSASTSPAPSPAPTPTSSPAFTCSINPTSSSSPTAPAVDFIDALRTGAHSGYDRLTVEFLNGEPTSIDVQPQTGTNFTLSPSGMPVTLAGTNGILITIHGSDLHTNYSGATDIVTHYSGMAEVRRVQDFEGVVQLAIGINGTACFQASVIANPTRLVIDVPA